MTEIISQVDPNLILIDELEDYKKHAVQLLQNCRRDLFLLSTELDFLLYNDDTFADALLHFVRDDRAASAKILVKNIRPLVERGHRLLNLARRLPSKVEIRKLLIEPEDETRSYLMGDKRCLLYKHDDAVYKGFVNYRAAPECQSIAEEFTYLWEQHSVIDPSLRSFII